MDTNIVGVGVGITDRFRSVVEEKLVRIEHLAPRAQRIDVKVTHRTYRTGRVEDHTVELTLTGKGPLVRAEATDADKFTALDMAVDKLCEQLRRAKDKRVDARNHPRKAMFDKERGELDGIDIQPASADVLRRVATGEVPIVDGEDDSVDVEPEGESELTHHAESSLSNEPPNMLSASSSCTSSRRYPPSIPRGGGVSAV